MPSSSRTLRRKTHGLDHVHIHDDSDYNYPMSPHIGEIDVDPMMQLTTTRELFPRLVLFLLA